MDFLKNLLALFIFFCIAAVLLYVGVAIFLVALAVGLVAAIWYGIKFYFIRKELIATLREHQETRFHSAVNPRRAAEEEGPVIEGEFVEVDVKDEEKP